LKISFQFFSLPPVLQELVSICYKSLKVTLLLAMYRLEFLAFLLILEINPSYLHSVFN
jgi:hypothetical protein